MTMESCGTAPAGAQYFGVYPAVVRDNQDPDRQGRVKVRLPWSPDSGSDEYAVWARLATTMAGAGRGTWFVPEIGDEVLISFGGGDPDWPYVVGALWNGQDDPPESMDSANNLKSIVSRTGIRIALDDTDGAVTLSLETPGGQKVSLEDGGSTIRIADANGNSLEMAPAGVTLTAASKLSISAQALQIDAGSAKVSAAMWASSGAIQCDTAIINSVVATAYTPGAGNFT
jgi:uncharacterized protein involved in type VI secretion and phage assembly